MNEEARKGRLFILAGPSGVGKGTLRIRALSDIERLTYSVSCTTREPRGGEREGTDYYFVTKQDFEEKLTRGMFLEHAVVHGDCYGTLREEVTRSTDAGRDVLLEIDVQGAAQVRRVLPGSVLIFIAPPSLEVLERRLRQRRTESEDKINLRLENAKKEMEQMDTYHHVVVNDDLERASAELKKIILGYR